MLPLVTAETASGLDAAFAEASRLLEPAEPNAIVAALAPALAQVVPSGMTQDDREEWFAASADSLRGIPADLLYRGLRVARATCDHPAKIVPAIMEAIRSTWAARRADRSSVAWLMQQLDEPPAIAIDVCTPERAAEILAEEGFHVRREASSPAAKKPEATVEDYIALGLSEAEARAAMEERRRILSRSRTGDFSRAAAAVVSAAA